MILMAANETVIKFGKNTPDINEVTVMSDKTESSGIEAFLNMP